MKKSVLAAMVIAGLAVVWIASGLFSGGETPPTEKSTTAEKRLAVQTTAFRAQPRASTLTINGQTRAHRQVTLRAQTTGTVSKILAERGDMVQEGDLIVQLSMDDRGARLARAQSLLQQRQMEYKASTDLAEKGFRSATRLAESKALLEQARAELKQIQLDIDHTRLTAPFDGSLATRPVELGDIVRPGDTVGMIVDLDPILLVVQVSEQDIHHLKLGQTGSARLVGGQPVIGTISYISPTANAATRTFQVELEVPNPDRQIVDGLTAEVNLPLNNVPAHKIPPAILTLNESGVIGVKTVDAAGKVAFAPVILLEDEPDGIWVAGLPQIVTLITVGQEFAAVGSLVDATPEKAAATPPTPPAPDQGS